MNRIWWFVMIAGIGTALFAGHDAQLIPLLLNSGISAAQLCLSIGSGMMLWSGFMEIMAATGDTERLGRLLRYIMKPLFPDMKDDACWQAMSLNLSANMLGLGNAATPSGIDAAARLNSQGAIGRRALAMLLVINNSSIQLIPTTIMSLRAAYGASQPTDIWLPTLIASSATTVAAILLMQLLPSPEGGW